MTAPQSAAILFAALSLGAAGAEASERSMRVICSLGQPVVEASQTVGAAVYTDAPAGGALHYRWHATAGAFLSGNASKVIWSAQGVAPGTYRLSVRVTGASGANEGCSLEVVVAGPSRSAPDVAGNLGSEAERDMLVRGSREDAGYGLYSYILLGGRPDERDSERYRAVLSFYLRLEDIRLGTSFSHAQLNATYVPVDRAPPKGADVEWVLDHYDWDRARGLIARLRDGKRDLSGDGPFLVSVLRPLSGEGSPDPCIIQNLSVVPLSVIPFWMQQFRSQTTQQRVWQRRTIATLALNLRTLLAVAAEGLPSVQQALASEGLPSVRQAAETWIK